MLKVNSFFVSATCISFLLLASCNNNTGEKTGGNQDSSITDTRRIDSLTPKKENAIAYKFATVEANLPAPFEMISDITGYSAEYRQELLNPYNNADYYITSYKKAVNMGVYGIDLAYVNFYGQNQDLLHYFGTIQKIAKELNFDKVFDQFSDRFKSNSGNKDSVAKLVDNVFDATDAYLKKNENYLAASHILAGALIEVNYLSLNLLKDVKRTPDNGKYFDKVYNDENVYIYHLIKLFEEYTDKDSKQLLNSLKGYQQAYTAIVKSSADLTPANLAKVTALINDVRNSLTQK